MAQWVGSMVSINCGDDTYQGEISSVTEQNLILVRPFCNGVPCTTTEVILRANQILGLDLIDKQEDSAEQSTVTVAKPIPKRAGRTASGSEGASSSFKALSLHNFSKSKPIDIEQKQASYEPNTFKSGTPNRSSKKGKWPKSWKDELCFGSPIDQTIDQDFDFEKNLALFDKQAIWDKINAKKTDILRQPDQSRRKNAKYRHDESIINGTPTNFRQIRVPKQEFCEYVTDEGLIIPSLSGSLRNRLWTVAERVGLTWEKRIELIGRAATEMSLQLVGGGHRLNPHNSHQSPTVVILCGPNRQGALGINTARHLESHAVNTVVYVTATDSPEMKQELELYKLTARRLVTTVSKLPQFVDLIILCLCEDSGTTQFYSSLVNWTNNQKAHVLALDPPANGTPGIITKFSLVPVLPLAHSVENGKIYLCNLGFPMQIFNEVGIKYKSPFGSKFVIPLHLNDEV